MSKRLRKDEQFDIDFDIDTFSFTCKKQSNKVSSWPLSTQLLITVVDKLSDLKEKGTLMCWPYNDKVAGLYKDQKLTHNELFTRVSVLNLIRTWLDTVKDADASNIVTQVKDF